MLSNLLMPAVLVATLALLPFEARATTYSYVGSPYSTVANFTPPCASGPCGNYSIGARVTGYFTTATPLPPNLGSSGTFPPDIHDQIASYFFSDGVNSYSSDDPNARIGGFYVATDARGNIFNYGINLFLWRTGSSPHTTSDRFSMIDIGNIVSVAAGSHDAAYNNEACITILTSLDQCSQYAPLFGSASQATSSGVGAFSVADATAPVPALSTGAVMLMAGLVLLGGTLMLRRR